MIKGRMPRSKTPCPLYFTSFSAFSNSGPFAPIGNAISPPRTESSSQNFDLLSAAEQTGSYLVDAILSVGHDLLRAT